MASTNLRDLVHLPPEEAKPLPRGWQILGTVILVSTPDALKHRANVVGDALLTMYPRCSAVLWNRGVAGRFREPVCEVIAWLPIPARNRDWILGVCWFRCFLWSHVKRASADAEIVGLCNQSHGHAHLQNRV